jgi:hypothetical protein
MRRYNAAAEPQPTAADPSVVAEPGSDSENIQRLPRTKHRRPNGHQRRHAELRCEGTFIFSVRLDETWMCRDDKGRA